MEKVSVDSTVPNMTVVVIGELTLWFSYRTVIAAHAPGFGRIVTENYWSATTGKHLNSIDGGNKKDRLKSDEFDVALTKMLLKYRLIPSIKMADPVIVGS
jgi:hypothetical protein